MTQMKNAHLPGVAGRKSVLAAQRASMNEGASQIFEQEFLSQELVGQIASCDRYELAPLFLELFADHQPVLEAGCGSGRWNGWLFRQGIRSDGVDWSQELCNRAQQQMPNCRFFSCDMGSVPVGDGTYGGLMALGSIEHVPEGPARLLREFYRVLRDDGVALITVPYGGPLRRTIRLLQAPVNGLKANRFVRRVAGKPAHGWLVREAAHEAKVTRRWYPRFSFGDQGWFFYEYEFSKAQMRRFLSDSGFVVQKEFAAFGDDGLLHTFGRMAGRRDPETLAVCYTVVGKGLKTLFPVSSLGHMLCYVLTKKVNSAFYCGQQLPRLVKRNKINVTIDRSNQS